MYSETMDMTSTDEPSPSLSNLELLSTEIAKLESMEEKLKKTIELMELSISQEGQPDFKVFWKARESCLELFKEDMPPLIRSGCWQKYRELTQQAKILKEHFEEESSFAFEQIEKAIEAVEHEIEELDQHVKGADLSGFPKLFPPIQSNSSAYINGQKELNLLNAYASRINALRKELVNTKMRMRKKSVFFERLSMLGNRVFPRRKELIHELSNQFINDVDLYIKQRFAHASIDGPPHVYRQEIKALQAAAKMLSLNSKAFSETRKKLSGCWDKIKEFDKQRKLDDEAKQEVFDKNAEEIRQKIQACKEGFSAEAISLSDAQKQIDGIVQEIKKAHLGREQVKKLHAEIAEVKRPMTEKLIAEEKKRQQILLEKEEQREAAIQQVEEKTEELSRIYTDMSEAELSSALAALKGAIEELRLSDVKQESMLRSLVTLEDAACEKQEQAEALPEDKAELKKALERRRDLKVERRDFIKTSFEEYRKASGSSSLDFERSLYNNEQLTIEKARLEKISEEIKSIEQQLSQL